MVKTQEVEKIKDKRQLRRLNQKDKILQAGEKLFAKKGFHLTTLEEIAKSANLAKGTIYLHFLNKVDLFISVIERKLNELLKKIKEEIKREKTPVERIKKAIRVHLAFLEQNKNFFRILQSLSGEYKREMEKELTERVIKKNAAYLGLIRNLIQEGIKEGQIKSLDAHKLSVMLVGIVHSLTINWITQGESYSLVGDSDLVWEIFWEGAGLKKNKIKGERKC